MLRQRGAHQQAAVAAAFDRQSRRSGVASIRQQPCGRRLDVGMDLQNILNANYGTVYETQYDYTRANGGTWLNPTTILGPRFARLNVTFNF